MNRFLFERQTLSRGRFLDRDRPPVQAKVVQRYNGSLTAAEIRWSFLVLAACVGVLLQKKSDPLLLNPR